MSWSQPKRHEASIEMEAIFEELAAKGILIATGRKEVGEISRCLQDVYVLAPGVTQDAFKRAWDDCTSVKEAWVIGRDHGR